MIPKNFWWTISFVMTISIFKIQTIDYNYLIETFPECQSFHHFLLCSVGCGHRHRGCVIFVNNSSALWSVIGVANSYLLPVICTFMNLIVHCTFKPFRYDYFFCFLFRYYLTWTIHFIYLHVVIRFFGF